MKIERIKATPIAIQDPPLLNAAGLHAPYALRIILEIRTDNDIRGISEIPGNIETLNELEHVQPKLLGIDPFHLSKIKSVIFNAPGNIPANDSRGDLSWDQRRKVHLYSAFEVACLDIMGKYTNRSVADLLGGRVRDRVPFSAYLFFKYKGAGGEFGFNTDPAATGWAGRRQMQALEPSEIVEQARAMYAEFGFKSLKLKAGILVPELETETVLALRKAFGKNIPIRIDPNGAWKYETALTCAKKLRGIVEYLEDPVRGQENMARLKKVTDIPLATNMCTTSFEDLPNSIRLKSEDIILCDHHFWGGLKSSVELANLCTAIGRSVSMHSNSHLGISLTAMAHLGSLIPELHYALDTHYPWQSDEVIRGGRVMIEDGYIVPPKGPGLGVELDDDALGKLHQNYLKCGLLRRDDEAAMQKVVPNWKFQPIRY